MALKRKILRWTLVLVVLLLTTAGVFYQTFYRAADTEGVDPDKLNLLKVRMGSRIEMSARFLSIPTPASHRVVDSIIYAMPAAIQPALVSVHPRNFFKEQAKTPPELALLKPEIHAPPWIRVNRISPGQNLNWQSGRPFFEVEFSLETGAPGDFTGEIKLVLGRRRASLPVKVQTVPLGETGQGVLIASSPFAAYSTSEGGTFTETSRIISSITSKTDLLFGLPGDLDPYRTILLADNALCNVDDASRDRLFEFVERGGRLLLACDAFFVATVPAANRILADQGLRVQTTDHTGRTAVETVVPDPLLRGVRRLEFHRPALIEVTDPAKGRILAKAPDANGGFIAAADFPGGGQIIVLSSSLWWNWVHQYSATSDNEVFLRNVLVR